MSVNKKCIKPGCDRYARTGYFTCSQECLRYLRTNSKCVVCACEVNKAMGVRDTCNKDCAGEEINRLRDLTIRKTTEIKGLGKQIERQAETSDARIAVLRKRERDLIDDIKNEKATAAKVKSELAAANINIKRLREDNDAVTRDLTELTRAIATSKHELELSNHQLELAKLTVKHLEKEASRQANMPILPLPQFPIQPFPQQQFSPQQQFYSPYYNGSYPQNHM